MQRRKRRRTRRNGVPHRRPTKRRWNAACWVAVGRLLRGAVRRRLDREPRYEVNRRISAHFSTPATASSRLARITSSQAPHPPGEPAAPATGGLHVEPARGGDIQAAPTALHTREAAGAKPPRPSSSS